MDLNAVQAFVAVSEQLSFTKAAKSSGLPKSYLSRKVQELEDSMGTRLFHRTTREVRLTDVGKNYFERCQLALSELSEAGEQIKNVSTVPKGHLRITTPIEFGPILTKYLAKSFLARNPAISIEILATNQVLDFVKDNIDLAIRPARVADPSTIALKLGSLQWKFFASKNWYANHKQAVQSPKDLKDLDLLGFNPRLQANVDWKFKCNNQKTRESTIIRFQPRFIASSFSVLIEAMESGIGVAAVPEFILKDKLKEKKLIDVFPNWTLMEEDLLAVYLEKKFMPARLRVLIDHFKKNAFII